MLTYVFIFQVIKQTTIIRLRNDNLAVVDLGKVTKTKVNRVDMGMSTLSTVGKEARDRAILEGERRFCGNKTEDITGAPVVMNKMEMVSMLLDLRTAGGSHVDKATYTKAKENLKDVYTEFALQCEKYDSALAKHEKGKEEEASSVKVVGMRVKPPTWNKGLEYIPGCAHDSEDDVGDESSGDEDNDVNSQTARMLELDKEFAKAWKNWKLKMASIDWTKVCRNALYIAYCLLELHFSIKLCISLNIYLLCTDLLAHSMAICFDYRRIHPQSSKTLRPQP